MLNGDRPDLFPAKHKNQIAASGNERMMDAPLEIPGIDTPEKVPRPIFSSRFMSNGDAPSSFSSIMHKFIKSDENQSICSRKKAFCDSNTCPLPSRESNNSGLPPEKPTFNKFGNDSVLIPNGHVNESSTLHINSEGDGFSPETPAIKPLVPRFKRILEESSNVDDDIVCLQKSSKRLKFLQDERYENKSTRELSDTENKFQWLQPCHIKDASGRRPDDSLYDKRTLYIPADALKNMSASQKQYWEVKCQYMDVLIFFKVGKFYELYELDAEIGRKELNWKMTLSGVGKCRQVGIPESGIDDAVQKLIARGYKVGRMEQLETSDQAKTRGANSVIQRKLIHVNTPSTAVDDNLGPDAVHLLAIKEVRSGLENGSVMFGFAFADCAALKFWVGSVSDDASHAALVALLMQVSPMEVIYENPGLSKEAQTTLHKYTSSGSSGLQLTPVPPGTDFLDAFKTRNLIQLKGYFKSSYNSNNYPLDDIVDSDLVLCALSGLVSQLSRMMLDDVLCNGVVLPYQVFRGCLRMDGQTLRNLEVFSNSADGGPAGTLYKYLNGCLTSSGKRILRNWICHPLNDVSRINGRLNFVESLMGNQEILLLGAQHLQKLPDLERLLGRVNASVHSSVSLSMPLLGRKSLKQRVKVFGSLIKGLRIGFNVLMLLKKEHHILMLFSEVLKNTVLSESDDLDEFLTKFEAAISTYFPNYQDHDVVEEDAATLTAVIEFFVERADQWSRMIHAISCFDVLRSFAVTASLSCGGAMCRPSVLGSTTGGSVLKMKGLWHPFALGETGIPVPNDIHLGDEADPYHPRTLLLTGPNMGGKSTLLRATCLAVLLAQLGCYVPCKECVLTPVDIIFTRLGATDHIMTGESTFYVECTETSSVLRHATENSLVLLDELGRGTSTFDGYAIAYAVFRHLIERVNCRLLFATHYHPLTKEFGSHPRVIIQHMASSLKSKTPAASEIEDLVFLYKLAPGPCPESYGMQVALMAGIPRHIVEGAKKAGGAMRQKIGGNFKSSEQRIEFSALHEEWLKGVLSLTSMDEGHLDDDAVDTLFTLWHELRASYRST